jgi:hypothetical protein
MASILSPSPRRAGRENDLRKKCKEEGKMRKWMPVRFFVWTAVLIFLGAFLGQAMAKEAPRMTKEELKVLMGKPDVVVIDVRARSDWDGSNEKIQGAVREDPKKAKEWANKYSKDKTLVFYCA